MEMNLRINQTFRCCLIGGNGHSNEANTSCDS
ncbi:hypothetical protein POVCU2_0001230, partial [Plasmodium ovale curtisi]